MVILEVNRSRHLSYRTGHLASIRFDLAVRADYSPETPDLSDSSKKTAEQTAQIELKLLDVYSRSEN